VRPPANSSHTEIPWPSTKPSACSVPQPGDRRRSAAEIPPSSTARKAGDHGRPAQQDTLAASYQALGELYRQREQTLAQALADRHDWEQATPASQHLAVCQSPWRMARIWPGGAGPRAARP